MNYHICRLVLSSLCVGAFVAAGIWWCSFCGLRSLRLCWWITTSVVLFSVRCVLELLLRLVFGGGRVAGFSLQHSRKLLKMDILMSETCWARNKWNKIASDTKLVFHWSTIVKALLLVTMYARIWIYKAISRPLYGKCVWTVRSTDDERLYEGCSGSPQIACSASRHTDVTATGLLSRVQWTVWILLLCFIVLTFFVVGYKQLLNLKYCTLCSFFNMSPEMVNWELYLTILWHL